MIKFKSLTREEKLEIIEAQLDGKPIELYDGRGWLKSIAKENVIFYADVAYRVAKTKDEFTNWEILPKEYKWIARSRSGTAFAFTKKPTLFSDAWENCFWENYSDDLAIKVDALTCYKQGTVDWKDSLIERPEGE